MLFISMLVVYCLRINKMSGIRLDSSHAIYRTGIMWDTLHIETVARRKTIFCKSNSGQTNSVWPCTNSLLSKVFVTLLTCRKLILYANFVTIIASERQMLWRSHFVYSPFRNYEGSPEYHLRPYTEGLFDACYCFCPSFARFITSFEDKT
jgi:hypothetical protein